MFGCKEVQGADPLCRHRARKSLRLSYYNLWGSFSDWISGAWEQPAINTKTSSVLKPWSRSVRARAKLDQQKRTSSVEATRHAGLPECNGNQVVGQFQISAASRSRQESDKVPGMVRRIDNPYVFPARNPKAIGLTFRKTGRDF